jgi:23S rRNA (guanosine2251-2'-O)-methyltransferase
LSASADIVYGVHAVRTLLARQPGRVQRVCLQLGRGDRAAGDIEQLARAAGVTVERVEAQRLRSLLGEAVHQGVMAQVRPLPPWREDELLQAATAAVAAGEAGNLAAPPLLLALDGVQDPHNLGACLRTADACGVLAVVVPRDRAAQMNATVRKVAAGAAETTPVVAVTNLSRTLGLLKQAGLWVVGADAGAPQPAHGIDLKGPRVLVLGAEGSGLRELTRRHCDWLVSLPALGAVESLNVSVAAGMLLYEAVRQRQGG